jgi:hypothetical protein
MRPGLNRRPVVNGFHCAVRVRRPMKSKYHKKKRENSQTDVGKKE